MAFSIQSNVQELWASSSSRRAEREIHRLSAGISTGARVTVAKDDAAGMVIVNKLRARSSGLATAIRSVHQAIGALQTGSSALSQITETLQRMRELAVQSANGTYTRDQRLALNQEFEELRNHMDAIATHTQWNGMNLLDGSFDKQIQTGSGPDENRRITIDSVTTQTLIPIARAPIVKTGTGRIEATPYGAQSYTTQVDIDTTGFPMGGTIDAKINLGQAGSAGSYDLFRNQITVSPFGDTSFFPTPTTTLTGSGILQATPTGTQNYTTIIDIDTSPYLAGGRILATVTLGNGASAANLDLFKNTVTTQTTGGVTLPINSLANAYSVQPGAATMLGYLFPASSSDHYLLAIEGDWNSPAGSTNSFNYDIQIVSNGSRPINSLDNAYGVGPGSTTNLSYDFLPSATDHYVLGLEGSWGNPVGSNNTVDYEITISAPGNIKSANNASRLISVLDSAISQVDTVQGSIGSQINGLTAEADVGEESNFHMSESISRIADLDYGSATGDLAKYMLLQKAAASMLVEAQKIPHMALELLNQSSAH